MSNKYFSDIDGDFCEEIVLCRLLHFWEARNYMRRNVLIGMELLLIDEKETTIQGFISAHRILLFQSSLKTNSVYKLQKFVVNASKKGYKVSDNILGITFTNQTVFDEVRKGVPRIDLQKFRIRLFQTFLRIADKKEDLFVGRQSVSRCGRMFPLIFVHVGIRGSLALLSSSSPLLSQKMLQYRCYPALFR